jgi:TonB family protein
MERPRSPWAISLTAHIAVLIAFIVIPARTTPAVAARQMIVTPLIYQPLIRKSASGAVYPPKTRQKLHAMHHAPRVDVGPPSTPTPAARRFQAFVHEPPKAVVIVAPEQVATLAVPLAPTHLSTPLLPSKPVPLIAVKTDVFGSGGVSPDGHIPASHLEVKTGGFGGADVGPVQSGGARGNGTMVRAAGFGGSDNGASQTIAGKGNGNSVRTGGFSDSAGAASAGSGNSRVLVADAGFGKASVQGPAPQKVQSAASETPVEVLWKPKPVYTEEARAKKLEGNVAVEVIFRATGDVQVLRVTRGLGAGLDEAARAAAQQIRFRPGKKDGVAVDRPGLVVITFELS